MDNIRDKTIAGLGWSMISQLGRQGLMLVINLVLARILSPREFGLLAMVTIIISFASIFAELGFSAALVQKQEVLEEQLSSVFWFNLGAGLLLTIIFIIGAPIIARFYNELLLIPLTILLSTNFIFSSLNIVQNTILTKSMDFRTLSIVEITAVGISGTVAILMACMGFGVWSLAVQSVVLSITTAILLWLLNDWRPSLTFRWDTIKELLGFSSNLFGTNIINYWVRNIDYLLIGRLLGTEPLGVYNRAYDTMLFPLSNVSRVLSRVMFPSFSIIQHDKRKIKDIFLKISRAVALVVFPMMMGLLVTAELFVNVIFGPKWIAMIPILRVFSIVGMMQSIGTLNGNLYLSQGRADLQFKVGTILRIFVIVGIIIGLQWGIVGVAYGFTITSAIIAYPSFYYAGRLVNLTYWQLLQNLASIFVCAATMAIFVWGIGIFLPPTWPIWIHLFIQVMAGIISYGLIIYLFNIRSYQEIRALIIEQTRPRFLGSTVSNGIDSK